MARFLSVADYGVLAALFYLTYILAIFSESIQTVFSKQAAVEEENGKLKNLAKRAMRKTVGFSILLFFLYVCAMFFFLSDRANFSLIMINAFFIFSSLLLPINRGIMQGKKKFGALGTSLIIESSIKLTLGIIFVMLGFGLYGAVGGALLGTFTALFFSFSGIKEIFRAEEKKAETLHIKESSKKIFLVSFFLLAFYITDIFIAQLIFDKETAGIYSLASVLSKAIFWGTQPIGRAMFPLTAEENKNKKNDNHTFFNAIAILGTLIFFALVVFYFFPSELIHIFSGKYSPESSQLLFNLGLATSALSFANLILLYKISKKEPTNKQIMFFGIIFITGIVLLYNLKSSIQSYSLAFLFASVLFLAGSILMKSGAEKL